MKKSILIFFVFIVANSCSKKETAVSTDSELSEKLTYDTTAIDSFAPGATPANVILNRAPKIDSADSAKIAKAKLEASLLKSKKEEEDKKKAKDEEAKKKDEAKKAEDAAKKKKQDAKTTEKKPVETQKTEPKPTEEAK